MGRDYTSKLGKVIDIDEGKIQDHLGEVVRGSVEETLNGLLNAEADRVDAGCAGCAGWGRP